MMTRPARPRHPLQATWWTNYIVVGDRIVTRIMHVMCPLIDIIRPWLSCLLPLLTGTNIRHASRTQNAIDFRRRKFNTIDNEEIYHVINVGKMDSVKGVS